MKVKTISNERFSCYLFSMMIRELIEKAIAVAGSQQKLADACGVTQPSIWGAKETGRCSAELAMAIERATEGIVKAAELRPDLPWPKESTAAGVSS